MSSSGQITKASFTSLIVIKRRRKLEQNIYKKINKKQKQKIHSTLNSHISCWIVATRNLTCTTCLTNIEVHFHCPSFFFLFPFFLFHLFPCPFFRSLIPWRPAGDTATGTFHIWGLSRVVTLT
jgi:hypothetical protein